MLDTELLAALRTEVATTLPPDLTPTFISSITGLNLPQLKDKLWSKLQQPNK
jgi:hypothetical protein